MKLAPKSLVPLDFTTSAIHPASKFILSQTLICTNCILHLRIYVQYTLYYSWKHTKYAYAKFAYYALYFECIHQNAYVCIQSKIRLYAYALDPCMRYMECIFLQSELALTFSSVCCFASHLSVNCLDFERELSIQTHSLDL